MHKWNSYYETLKEDSYLKKKKDEVTIRSSAAEYLTYVATVGNRQDSIEMRYEDENIWLTQKMMAYCMMWAQIQSIIILKRYSRIVNCRRIQLFENFE